MSDRSPIEYDDLAIRIGPDGRGGYEARVVNAPRGGAVSAPFEPPFEAHTLDAVLDGVARAVRAGFGARHVEAAPAIPGEPIDPKGAGKSACMALFEALFRDGIRRCLERHLPGRPSEENRGLRLRLIIDPQERGCAAIAALPWELLYDPAGRGFLAIRMRTPVVRYLEVGAAHAAQAIRGPLRVLVVLASPAELPRLDLDAERAAAEQWGQRSGVAVEVLDHATIDALKRRLRRRSYHALHFTGHGDFPSADERGVLLFECGNGGAEPADGELLAAILDGCHRLRLVVLNACFGGRIPRREGRDPYAGVASALVRSGIPAVVAMQFPISDTAAIRFCGDFYQALAEGDPVDAAVADGRLGVLRAESSSLEWAAPVLHLRVTDGRLFERRPPGRRRLAAVAGGLLLAAVVAAGGWLWLGRSGDGSAAARIPYHKPVVPPAVGCPPPPALPDMAFVRIEPGRLELPPPKGREGEGPRLLEVEKPFCLGALEVTEGERRTILGIGDGDRDGSADEDLPAGGLRWGDVEGFLERINRGVPGRPFRLPTGTEWEYAARAGTTTAYSFGDDPAELHRYGNCLGSGESEEDGFDNSPAPVGSFEPNPWALYDMHGNVWEWVDEQPTPEDLDAASRPPSDAGADPPLHRIKRGGAYDSHAVNCASAARSPVQGERRPQINGLRLARDVEPST